MSKGEVRREKTNNRCNTLIDRMSSVIARELLHRHVPLSRIAEYDAEIREKLTALVLSILDKEGGA